jgi:hypothetical protein
MAVPSKASGEPSRKNYSGICQSAMFGAVMIATTPTGDKAILSYGFGGFCISIALVCFAHGRLARFLGSAIASVVFCAGLAYLADEITGGRIVSNSRSEPSVLNAVMFMLVFGLPAGAYVLKAKFEVTAMDTWRPVTVEELDALVVEELAFCSPEQHQLFERCKVTPYPVAIDRQGKTETVFVVAKAGNTVLYYEDVEEGFNVSPLSHDGSIAAPGYEQWELCHALEHLGGLLSIRGTNPR